MFMEFEKGSGTLEVALLLETALGLDFAELVERLLELAGEPLAVHAESGESAVCVDDVKADSRLLGGRVGGAVKEGGFEHRDAVDAPGGVGELLGELSLGGSGGPIFVEELAAVLLVGDGILCGEDRGTAGETVGHGVLGRGLFAGDGVGSGGEEGIRPVRAKAGGRDWDVGIGDWRGNWVSHLRNLRCGFSMGGWRFRAGSSGCCWVGG